MSNQVVKVAKGTYCLPVPQPWGEPTNIYLLEDEKLTLIDIGYSAPENMNSLTLALAKIGHTWKDVRQIIYTHPHMDHIGGGSCLVNCNSLLQIGHPLLVEGEFGYSAYLKNWRNMVAYFTLKYPETTNILSEEGIKDYFYRYFPKEENINLSLTVNEGDIISLGRRELCVYYTPGHHPYHIALYEPVQKLFFSGDFLLPKGATVLSLSGGNPQAYRCTLLRFRKKLDNGMIINKIMPGHGAVFSDAQLAIEMELETLEKFQQKIINFLTSGPKTCLEITHDFFGQKLKERFIGMSLGIIDTLLDWLLLEGLIGCQENKETKLFYIMRNCKSHKA